MATETLRTSCSISASEKEAGYLIGPTNVSGTGITYRNSKSVRKDLTRVITWIGKRTSEQSMSLLVSCPRSCNLAMAALNWDIIRF